MNPDLARLQPYPFQRLSGLLAGIEPPAGLPPIALSIGEPGHRAPAVVREVLIASLDQLSHYPSTRGGADLRRAIADWVTWRFGLETGTLDPERNVLPVNGTREALFAFAQAVVDRTVSVGRPRVGMPNPFYQIYEGAALLAGAEPLYIDLEGDRGAFPDLRDLPRETLDTVQLLYLCSPGNPSGAVMDLDALTRVIELADRHDFVIASDECYSELYPNEDWPPPGLLQACAAMGRRDFRRCVVFHSLSKRSNVPGLRSGFVAGDAEILGRFFSYRTYHGCAMSPPTQAASAAAWRDEAHVRANRQLYREKFEAVLEILGDLLPLRRPDGGFYLWAPVPQDDLTFTRELFRQAHVTVLPGTFLSRDGGRGNPGGGRVRIALVPPLETCCEAAERIRAYLAALP